MTTVQPLPRPVALAKLLLLGQLPHAAAVQYCGWPDEEFRRVAAEANRQGLITWKHRFGTRIYRAGKSARRSERQSCQ